MGSGSIKLSTELQCDRGEMQPPTIFFDIASTHCDNTNSDLLMLADSAHSVLAHDPPQALVQNIPTILSLSFAVRLLSSDPAKSIQLTVPIFLSPVVLSTISTRTQIIA